MSYARPLRSRDFSTSHHGAGYIAAHASTRGCVRSQAMEFGSVIRFGSKKAEIGRHPRQVGSALDSGHSKSIIARMKSARLKTGPSADLPVAHYIPQRNAGV